MSRYGVSSIKNDELQRRQKIAELRTVENDINTTTSDITTLQEAIEAVNTEKATPDQRHQQLRYQVSYLLQLHTALLICHWLNVYAFM